MAEKPERDSTDTGVDPVRLAELYAAHAPGLRRLVFGILHDRQFAEDVVHATFAKAAQGAGGVAPEAIKSWLYRVAFNEAITWKRRTDVNRKALLRLSQRASEHGSQEPEEALIRAELVEQVCVAIRLLPAPQRQALEARIYHGKTFAEIAAEMNAPLGTVLTHVRRALEKLRTLLPRKE